VFNDQKFPVAERMYAQGFYIPSGLGLTDEQVLVVAEKVRKVLQ
jgi:perosamine synthetase